MDYTHLTNPYFSMSFINFYFENKELYRIVGYVLKILQNDLHAYEN